ncbi:MAG: hemolysin family protein [Chloroflexi bacterium]|nr:hemolysin family protein [Chloroflexota bacterium]MCC6895167.1 HlyC/CorC family transporter [Anaerolineae bacterium]
MDVASIVPLTGLILLHAVVALAYAALTNTREPLFRDQTEAEGDAPPRLHITYKLSTLLLRFAIAAVAVTQLAHSLASVLHLQNDDVELLLADILVLIPTALVTIILGDLVPEAIGSTRAESLARWFVLPMRLLIIALTPLVVAIMAVSRWIAGVVGSSDKVNVYTEEEIMTILDAGEKEGSIEEDEKEMIYSVLQFGDKTVREVMIPRIDVIAIEIDTSVDESLALLLDSGHSRIPVYEENIDNIKGLLYAKDLLRVMQGAVESRKPLSLLLRQPFFVPDSKRADELLAELRTKKVHMAVVVDEYGGTAGIVTFEDLIEEIIGDVQDEYDTNEEQEYIELGPNTYRIDAGISLTDFNDLLDVELPTESSDTLGGFLFAEFGRVPEVGESLEHETLTFRVESLVRRRIVNVHVVRRVVEAETLDENTDTVGVPASAVSE